ncbi:UTRA domain-containing protein [Cohnella fermenti]|uniref:UTRA domain-containing protein n=1 Tax=Cohnella fermenti TaxID=2565925 RepID=UPI001454C6A0|nr:UTRA domain-containing protein [Cohnella fermenti]
MPSSSCALTEEGTPQRLLFGQRCIRIERLYRLDGEPYIYYTHDLTDRAGDVRDSELVEQSLYGWLEERGAAIASCRDELSVSLAPPAAALAALGLPEGTPLLKRTRYSYGPDGAAVEYGKGFYATDKHLYVIQYDVWAACPARCTSCPLRRRPGGMRPLNQVAVRRLGTGPFASAPFANVNFHI